MRLFAVGALVLIVAGAALGLLGVRTVTKTVSSNGFTIEVRHAAVSRAGLATPFDVAVRTDDGSPLPAEVRLRVSSPYLAMLDDNGMEPLPVTSFNDGRWTWWTFEIPEGERALTVSLDARMEPAVQWGRDGAVAVDIEGREVVMVEFDTWVSP